MNMNTLQTIKARKIAEACEGITAEEFLSKFDHLLFVALRLAELSSHRDSVDASASSSLRGKALEDKETWQVFAETIDRLSDPVAYAAHKRSLARDAEAKEFWARQCKERAANRYCDAN